MGLAQLPVMHAVEKEISKIFMGVTKTVDLAKEMDIINVRPAKELVNLNVLYLLHFTKKKLAIDPSIYADLQNIANKDWFLIKLLIGLRK